MLPGIAGITGFTGEATVLDVVDTREAQTGSTFSAVSYGDASNRSGLAFLLFHHNASSNPGATPSLTASGGAIPRRTADSTGDGVGTAAGTAIFTGSPSGASGDVVIGGGWAGTLKSLVVVRVVGFSMTPNDAGNGSDADANKTGDSITGGLDIPANGAIIAILSKSNVNNTTWTGATERGDNDISSGRSWAFDINMSLQAGRTVSASWSGSARATISGVSLSPL